MLRLPLGFTAFMCSLAAPYTKIFLVDFANSISKDCPSGNAVDLYIKGGRVEHRSVTLPPMFCDLMA